MNDTTSSPPEVIIISVGGSLVYTEEGLNTPFLKSLNRFIRQNLKNRRFFLVIGGGKICRRYQHAAKSVIGSIADVDIDWLGIHATHLNGHLIRTIFHDIAHSRVIENYEKPIENLSENLIIAAGWKPGWSTDYCATLLARDYGSRTIINLSDIDYIYEDDPDKNPSARPIKHLTWPAFRELVGEDWKPGMHSPFDPIASKLASELGLTVINCSGHSFKNLSHILHGEPYKGTTITPPQENEEEKEFIPQPKSNLVAPARNIFNEIKEGSSSIYRSWWIINNLHPKNVLIVGCGSGELVARLRSLGVDCQGVDDSEEKINAAPRHLRPFLQVSTLDELPYEDDRFELVISMEILQDFPRGELSELASEINRVSSKYILHKIITLENRFLSKKLTKDASPLSLTNHKFWVNFFHNLDGVTFPKKQIWHLPLFLESVFLLQKDS